MKNENVYVTLEERIEKFQDYCGSQPSCPCKYHNENCELKWLNDEATVSL